MYTPICVICREKQISTSKDQYIEILYRQYYIPAHYSCLYKTVSNKIQSILNYSLPFAYKCESCLQMNSANYRVNIFSPNDLPKTIYLCKHTFEHEIGKDVFIEMHDYHQLRNCIQIL